MPRLIRVAPILSLLLTVIATSAPDAFAQTLPMLRVVRETAAVRTRPALLSEVLKTTTAGTVLEAVDRENDWYWVILPPDENGTRMPGWIRARDVEIVAVGAPDTTLRHFTAAIAQAAREPAEAPKEDKRLERTRQQLEEARRAYDALTEKTPAESQTAALVQAPRADAPKAKLAPELEWFGGYSFYRDQRDDLSFPGGWAFSAARRWNDALAIVGQMSGSHRSESIAGANVASANLYTFTVGPKYARRTGRVDSYGEVLIGVARTQGSAFGVSDSSTGFALQPGVGVDVPLARNLALRVGFNAEAIHDAGGWFGGIRFTTGVMFVTGSAR